ncbi:MAG: hypothetical protein AAFX06_07935 [Planctomycetota bacterium]
MRSITLVACALMVVTSSASTFAEESCRGLFEDAGFARFRLQSGRLVLDPIQYRKGTQKRERDGRSETIVLSSAQGVPSLHYTSEDDYQRVQMLAEHGKSLRIESTILATGEVGVYTQVVGEPIVFRTQRGNAQLNGEVQGKTLLHIVGQDEAGFQVHLESLLTRMLRGRSVLAITLQTHQYLSKNLTKLPAISINELESIIEELRHPEITHRRDASRKLAELGSLASPFLVSALRRDDLDSEQRARIEHVVRRSDRYDEDTVTSLAFLLSTDRHHWSIIAKRLDQQDWLAANHHIRRCGLPDLKR